MDWLSPGGIAAVLITTAGTAFVAYLALRGKRGETKVAAGANETAAIGARWDDASELATKMREYIATEVERQVAPIRAELETVKREHHEMNDVVRAHATQIWLWDVRGRVGHMPMLPDPILVKLGLGHLTTERINQSKE